MHYCQSYRENKSDLLFLRHGARYIAKQLDRHKNIVIYTYAIRPRSSKSASRLMTATRPNEYIALPTHCGRYELINVRGLRQTCYTVALAGHRGAVCRRNVCVLVILHAVLTHVAW